MCFFGGPPEDNSAALARQAEEERQGRITQGTGQVNQTFSKFDDSFFDGVSKASNDFFLPQVQDQFEAARRKLVLGLGGRGTLNGSSGARQLGDLTKSFETQNASFANQIGRAHV